MAVKLEEVRRACKTAIDLFNKHNNRHIWLREYEKAMLTVFKYIHHITLKLPRKVAELINVPLTIMNAPEIILSTMEITLTKDEFEEVCKYFEFSIACFAGCGYASVSVHKNGSKVTVKILPCDCHPTSYLLSLRPKH